MLVGCSGWNYPDPVDKGGWVGPFYPDSKTRFLHFYSKYFRTAEMDSTFYENFYSKMTKGTFIGIGKVAPKGFQISVKCLQGDILPRISREWCCTVTSCSFRDLNGSI